MSKLKNLTNPVVIFSILGIICGLVLIYMARNQSFNEADGESLGYVGVTTEDVRLKRVGNMHWYIAEENQQLYHGDLIFSGDKARTVLQLKDHGELTLGPYSMVIIQAGFIQVESGEIELKAKKATIIKTFGEEVKVSSKTSTTVIDRPTLKKITLSKKDEAKPTNIKAQEVIRKAVEKEIKVAEVIKKPEIVDLQILGLLSVWEPETTPMRLTFSSTEKFNRVEVSVKNDSFEKQYTDIEAIELKDLPAGQYRINALGYYDDKIVSRSSEQQIEVVIPIVEKKQLEAPKIKHSKIKYTL